MFLDVWECDISDLFEILTRLMGQFLQGEISKKKFCFKKEIHLKKNLENI